MFTPSPAYKLVKLLPQRRITLTKAFAKFGNDIQHGKIELIYSTRQKTKIHRQRENTCMFLYTVMYLPYYILCKPNQTRDRPLAHILYRKERRYNWEYVDVTTTGADSIKHNQFRSSKKDYILALGNILIYRKCLHAFIMLLYSTVD